MKKRIKILCIGLLVGCLFPVSNILAQEKIAQTGFQFLSVVSDARASGMAEAMTSLQTGSSALFFNPAGMAGMNGMMDISASNNKWIADIEHYAFSAAVKVKKGQWGVFGVSVQSVSYGKIFGTFYEESERGYVDWQIYEPSALAAGLGYAKEITEKFAVGGQIRIVNQDLGESVIPNSDTSAVKNELTPLAYDFGTIYKTGFKSLVFGMSVRNFSKEIKYVEESFQLPLVFNLGVSMNVMDFFENYADHHALNLSIDACHYRSHPEQIKLGLEYTAMDILTLRGGYISNNDENSVTFGMGVSYMGLGFDYAYTPFGVFDNVQRMTIRFAH